MPVEPLLILGSRSPRRLQLLQDLYGCDRVRSVPPANPQELGFAGLVTDDRIRSRLLQIVQQKLEGVRSRLSAGSDSASNDVIICADTIIVAGEPDQRVVLGQPPAKHWQNAVRSWFTNLLSGKTHQVHTAVLVACGQQVQQQVITTLVTFHDLSPELIDWYLATAESIGKAGGYAIQGKAAAFVAGVSGSLTCVIGLPLQETSQLIRSVIAAEPGRT